MIEEADRGAGLVIGSRYCPGGGVQNWHLRRVLLSRYANRYVRLVTGLPTNDSTAGFRCWSREALEAVHLSSIRSEGYGFQVEMTYRAMQAGVRIAEVPIVFRDRRFGVSKLSGHMIWEAARLPWQLRRRGKRFAE
jgi:dolichol-phosphate mannosyltransferase